MDYEKKYKEALERAKNFIENGDERERTIAESIFAGIMEESEDERIRKELITFFQRFPYERIANAGTNVKEAIAWLEKQGEQKPADKIEPKFKIGQIIKKEGFNLGFTIAKIEDDFYYNDEGDYFPFTDQDNWELVEQNPAWSEDDNKLIDSVIELIDGGALDRGEKDYFIEKLKSLKDRVQPQPKQEWGEEDEKMMSGVVGILESWDCSHTTLDGALPSIVPNYVSWLMSLRPQNHWKPSEVQMEILQYLCENSSHPNEKVIPTLESLYQDLKKLKG